jgi:hypothetical protein
MFECFIRGQAEPLPGDLMGSEEGAGSLVRGHAIRNAQEGDHLVLLVGATCIVHPEAIRRECGLAHLHAAWEGWVHEEIKEAGGVFGVALLALAGEPVGVVTAV